MAITPYLSAPFGGNGTVPNLDQDSLHPEDDFSLPWCIDPVASWLAYDNSVEVNLDAGMALHKPLPQQALPIDSLGHFAFNDPDLESEVVSSGVQMTSGSNAIDLVQRMATSTYFFIMRGFGIRIGYQIPIPFIKQVGQAIAYPDAVQRAYNKIIGNFSGIPLWYAQWELHYFITQPLGQSSGLEAPVPPNLALHLRPDAELPLTVLFPRTVTDQNAVTQSALKTK